MKRSAPTKSGIMRLEGDRRGTVIRCLEGVLWVTQEGDDHDYLLKRGDTLVVTRKGLVLAQGFPANRVRVAIQSGDRRRPS